MPAKHLVFVYGSLLRGLHNHHVISSPSTRLIGKARTSQCYYMIAYSSHYPFLLLNPLREGHIAQQAVGEVYEVDDRTLARLDELEGYTPGGDNNEYSRREIEFVYENDSQTIDAIAIATTASTATTASSASTTGEPRCGRAFIYLYENQQGIMNMATKPQTFQLVNSGNWREYLQSRGEGGVTEDA